MTGWIILSIICVMLSPLVWMLPSRRQSTRMALRLEARRLGLGMQLAREEWPHWLLREPPGSCAQYHCPRRSAESGQWQYWQTEPGTWVNRWREPCADERVMAHLQGLPGDVYKVEVDARMLSLYWGERGDAQVLQHINEAMKALARL
ncbi:hypothetical protein NRB16_21525 [Pseudomonas sp. LJDD11]|uniref:hypothetical protein n=1 Tax=unclassified Pseudomonas TaxID=196821 RepID=UPI0005EE8C25|nr:MULTISPECIES: hypothetical protein [unclassified Pseudomonas]MCQ9426104.1 hypothetical protein [Pseudomonas sp. LJDD11]